MCPKIDIVGFSSLSQGLSITFFHYEGPLYSLASKQGKQTAQEVLLENPSLTKSFYLLTSFHTQALRIVTKPLKIILPANVDKYPKCIFCNVCFLSMFYFHIKYLVM